MSQSLSPVRHSLLAFRAAYPNATITNETIDVYEAALRDLEPRDLRDAVAALVKESKFMPSISEIRETVGEHRLALPSPTEAWVEAQGRSFGTWEGVRHPLVHKAIQAMGGTYSIKTSENPSIMQSQFLKAYKEFRDAAISQFVRTGQDPELPELPTPQRLVELPTGEYTQVAADSYDDGVSQPDDIEFADRSQDVRALLDGLNLPEMA